MNAVVKFLSLFFAVFSIHAMQSDSIVKYQTSTYITYVATEPDVVTSATRNLPANTYRSTQNFSDGNKYIYTSKTTAKKFYDLLKNNYERYEVNKGLKKQEVLKNSKMD